MERGGGRGGFLLFLHKTIPKILDFLLRMHINTIEV